MARTAAPIRWIGPSQAAALFGMRSPSALRRWDGLLTVRRTLGGHRRYLESECAALADQLRQDGSALVEAT